jgi:hypothetical protein
MKAIVTGRQCRRGYGSYLVPLVSRSVRPRPAGVGVDEVAEGHGHALRDQPLPAGRPPEYGDEEAHGLGRDHLGTHRGDGLVRQKVAYPGFGNTSGLTASNIVITAPAGTLYMVFHRATGSRDQQRMGPTGRSHVKKPWEGEAVTPQLR